MQTTEIVIFSSNQDLVIDTASEIKDLCEQKGIEYKGPHPQAEVNLNNKQVDLHSDGVKLFGENPSEREIEELENKVIYSRKFLFHRYSSDKVVKEIVKQDYPSNVFLRIKVRETEFINDQGSVPFSYDPNNEYNTDL